MWKAFDLKSWSALLSSLAWLKGAADNTSSAVSGLGEDFAKLSELTTQELDGKQDKRNAVAATIPAAGWSSDGTAGYPYYCDLAVPGVTAKDRAEVTVSVAGLTTAADCGLCPTNETLDGKIRLRAKKAPAAAMSAEYWLEKGAQGL